MKRILTLLLLLLISCTAIAEDVSPALEPPAIKSEYILGEYDENLVAVKERLHALGYYSDAYVKDRSLSCYYNITLYSRIRLFQIFNSLPVTGCLDASTVSLLFSEKAQSEEAFFSQEIDDIPDYLGVVTSNAANYSSFDEGFALRPKVKNWFPDKKVVAYEVAFIPYNAWHEKMENFVYSDKVTSTTIIKPGTEQYSAKCIFINQEEMFDVLAGVTRFRMDDGTIINVPEDKVVYHSWRAPFTAQ